MAWSNFRSKFLETGRHKVGLHLWDRDGDFKWPSISERRSPTETTSNHIDLDRTRMPIDGLAKLTIQTPRNWTTHSRATSLGTEMATFKAARPKRHPIILISIVRECLPIGYSRPMSGDCAAEANHALSKSCFCQLARLSKCPMQKQIP